MNFLEKHVGAILATLVASFLLGTIAMIYNADKNNAVFKAQLSFIVQRVTAIESDIKMLEKTISINNKESFTKTDHNRFSKKIDERFRLIWKSIDKLDRKVERLKGSE